MLLDLNVAVVSDDSVCHVTRAAMELEKKFSEEDSAASSYSLLSCTEGVRRNGAERNSPLIFDILKVENPAPEFSPRPLFPATVSSTSAKALWLNNLSFVGKNGPVEPRPLRKTRRGPRSKSSQYLGVTFYRRTGGWESHIWDSGKQVYLGGFDSAYAAARAYDQAAIKFRGVDADINFRLSDYEEAMKQTQNLNKEEFVLRLRGRRRTVLSEKSSKYQGARLQKCGPWEAAMGQFLGSNFVATKRLLPYAIEIMGMSRETTSLQRQWKIVYMNDSPTSPRWAYDKATLPCNTREAAINLGPSAGDEANIVIHANSGGNFYNLDLSLGIEISSPSNAQKGNAHAKDIHFQYGEMVARMEKMIENTALSAPLAGETLGDLPVTSDHGIYPNYLPTLEARTWLDE